jgi:NitT/TauT family transport system substrate-binding protein
VAQLAACGGGTGAAPTTTAPGTAAVAPASATPEPKGTVKFGANVLLGLAPVLVGVDSGAFAAKNIDVQLEPITDGVRILVSVAAGQLDMGQTSMGAATFNALNRGTDVKVVASGETAQPGPGQPDPLIVRSDLFDSGAVKTVSQLKGKKIALNAKGNVLEYALYKALLAGNLTLADVNIVYMPNPDQVIALANKAIDAALMPFPFSQQAIDKGYGKTLSDDFWPNAQITVLVVNSKYADANPAIVTNFLEAYVRQLRRVNDGKYKTDDQALAILEKYTKTPIATLKSTPPSHWPNDAKISRTSVSDEQDYFLRVKGVEYTIAIPLDRLIDERFLEAALKKIGN